VSTDERSKIGIGSDHAAYELKVRLAGFLESQGFEVLDRGPHDGSSVDYADFAAAVCRDLLSGKIDRAVLLCGSGIGMSMAANRYLGVRAALCATPELARLSRQHNNANILVLGARFIDPEQAIEVLTAWLATDFEGGRHLRRVEKMDEVCSGNACS